MNTIRTQLRGRKLAFGALLMSTSLPLLTALTQAACSSGPDSEPSASAVGTTAQAITSTKADKSLTIEVLVPTLSATAITSNESGLGVKRDETYLRVTGQTPSGIADARLPRQKDSDDYYEVFASNPLTESVGWTNQDQMDQGYPRVWNGTLMPGQVASFQIAVMEQDWKDGADLQKVVLAACDGIELGANIYGAAKGVPYVPSGGDSGADGGSSVSQYLKDIVGNCKTLASRIPVQSADDLIGVFQIDVANIGGKLALDATPVALNGADTSRKSDTGADHSYQAAQEVLGRLVDTFYMTGAGSAYRADIAVKVTDGITNPLRYIGTGNDACGESKFLALGSNGPVQVFQGTQTDVRINTEE